MQIGFLWNYNEDLNFLSTVHSYLQQAALCQQWRATTESVYTINASNSLQ